MRRADVARLLTIAAAVDNRNLDGVQGDAAVGAWGQVIGHLGFEECVAAVAQHRRTAPGVYLEPGHVLAIVEAAAPADDISAERAALDRFVAYTGMPRELVAARWNDQEWKDEQINEARTAHQQRALEGGQR